MIGLVAVSAVTVLAACSSGSTAGTASSSSPSNTEGTPQKGGTLNMLGVGDVDYMDPNISYYSGGYMAMRLFSRQPYTYSGEKDKAGQTVPDLATDLPKTSPDGLSATITIRDGAKWDTTPPRQITAADLIRGIKRTCNPAQPFTGLTDFSELIAGYQQFCDGFKKVGQTAAAIAGYINGNEISGLKVGSDDRTLAMTLTHPASYLADMMTLTAFSPAPKEYDAYVPASAELAQHTISSGPYKITSYSPTKSITFDRNPAWDAASDPVRKSYVDKIVVDETRTQESIQQQLQTGTPSADMEWDTFPPPSALPGLLAAKDPKLNLGETSSSNPYVVFNLKSPNNGGAMAKTEVRQALEYALNRNTIIQASGGPKIFRPLTHVLPPSIVGGEQNFDLYPHDAAKAKQMLTTAGVTNPTIKVLYRNQAQGSVKAFATIQQDLKEAGITVTGVAATNADFYTKYLQRPNVAEQGVWDMAIAGWGADWHGNAALSFFLPLFSGEPSYPQNGGSNFGYYNSPVTNDIIKQAVNAKTTDEAKALWHKADQQVMQDAVIFPITNRLEANYRAEQVHNAVFIDQLQEFDPANVWLDPAKNGG